MFIDSTMLTPKIRQKMGFTLIEVLIVTVIIGVLAAVVILNLDESQKKGRDSKRISDTQQIAQALGMFYEEKLRYPNDVDDGLPTSTIGANSSVAAEWNTMKTLLDPYIPTFPPVNTDNYSKTYNNMHAPLWNKTGYGNFYLDTNLETDIGNAASAHDASDPPGQDTNNTFIIKR